MKTFFKWLDNFRLVAPLLLSCLPFKVNSIHFRPLCYKEEGEHPEPDNRGYQKLPEAKKSRKVQQRTGVRHKKVLNALKKNRISERYDFFYIIFFAVRIPLL